MRTTSTPRRYLAADLYFQWGIVSSLLGLASLVIWALNRYQIVPAGKDPATLEGSLIVLGFGLASLIAWRVTTTKATKWLEDNPV